jgi:hypothetical protein
MTLKLTSQARVLAALGLALGVALAAMIVLRSGLLDSSDSSTLPAGSAATQPKPATAPVSPAKPTPAVTRPKIELLPGLPSPVAKALRRSRVVVVSLYAAPSGPDRGSVNIARRGARSVGAGFVAIDVFRERDAKQLEPFAGTVSAPALLVVRRPGTIVTRFVGYVDDRIVAQAAHNAGARKAPSGKAASRKAALRKATVAGKR